MRIAVHAKALSEREPVGIGIYTYNLLKNIARLDASNEYVLYSNEPILKKIEGPNFREKILRFPRFWTYLRFPFEFVSSNFDLLFVPKEFVPPLVRPRTVITCYDLGRYRDPRERTPLDARMHYWVSINFAFKAADHILAISEATRRDLIEKCSIDPSKITVTPLGYDMGLYRPCGDDSLIKRVKDRHGIKGDYFINTSSLLWQRKNIPGVIRAFDLFRKKTGSDAKLVITGKRGEAYEEIIRLISALGLEKWVILTGYVPDEEMPVLLGGAIALVFPSFYEGFGLPIVEAMACGCPVVTSNVSSLPEVAGDAGILVDPADTGQIAGSMEKVFSDKTLRRHMVEKGFERARPYSWENTARETLKVFRSLS